MRTYVSNCFIGKGVVRKTIASLAAGELMAYDNDKKDFAVVSATTKVIGFALGTATGPVFSAPISKAGIVTANQSPYKAAVAKKMTLTVTAVPAEGETAVLKVVYHDNLSIIPNQMKSTIINATAGAGETTSTFAAKLRASLNAQEFKFYTVTAATSAVVTLTGLAISTQTKYNHIDRPEFVNFEIAISEKGSYTVATTVNPSIGQGDPAKMQWLEEQHLGRRGVSDRRSWNTPSPVSMVNPAETYTTLVIESNNVAEGEMQDTMAHPVGIVIGDDSWDVTKAAGLAKDLATAGVVLEVIPAS